MPAPETLLILDTETTGLTAASDHCIEVGAILFSTSHRAVLSQVSFLIPCLVNPAEHVNHIPAIVTCAAQPWKKALELFKEMVDVCDVVVAHNSEFDAQWFGIGSLPAIDKPWICTMADVRWPASLRLKGRPSVTALALAHGIPVWAAHRALTDCIYLAQVLERCTDLEALLQSAKEPREVYVAVLPYDRRNEAKVAGFNWEADKKQWRKKLTASEAETLGFPVRPLA